MTPLTTALPDLAALGSETTLVLLGAAVVCGALAVWRLRGPVAVGLLFLSTGFLVATLVQARAVEARERIAAQRLAVTTELLDVRARLNHAISADANLLQALGVHIALDPERALGNFDAIAAQLLQGHHRLRNIAIAPDLVVTRVYPMAGNEAVLGLDYRTHPQQRLDAERAVDARDALLAGPIDLVQGGRGFVARRAVYLTGADGTPGAGPLWGLISTVIDADQLLAQAGISPDGTAGGLGVGLRGTSASGPAGPVFLGAPDLFEPEASVVLPVELPVGTWALAGRPVQGWDSGSSSLAVPAALVALWLMLLGLWASRLRLVIEQGQSAEAERQRAESFRQMFTASSAPMLLVDRDGLAIRDANAAAASMYGADLATLRTMRLTDLEDPSDTRADTRAAIQAVWDGEITSFDVSHRGPGDRKRELELFASPLSLADHHEVLHVILQDVTARRRFRRELVQARDAALAASQAKDAFLANMSHEIRTPMNGILGAAQLLESTELDTQQDELIAIVRGSAASLLRILDDILDLSKIRQGLMAVSPVPTDVRRVANAAAALARPAAAAKGVTLAVHVDDDVPEWVSVDGLRLRQVLGNLLSNAVKFTEQGRVDVLVHAAADERVVVDVKDTGIGMTPEQLARVFEPFEQADAGTTQRFGGTGLGTTISRKLAELMGGSLDATSEPSVGSVFRVELPAPAVEPAASAPETSTPAFDRTVLLAEDNAVNARIATLLLERLGMRVVHVVDGQAAVAAVNEDVDLVFMDIRMPGTDGIEATRMLRARGLDVPIVALTANVMEQDRIVYRDSGFNEVLGKPLVVDELVAVCQRFLGERQGAA